jgi:hypothetical protein
VAADAVDRVTGEAALGNEQLGMARRGPVCCVSAAAIFLAGATAAGACSVLASGGASACFSVPWLQAGATRVSITAAPTAMPFQTQWLSILLLIVFPFSTR